jgi:putative tricarboxylic transport membrane protein
MAQAHPLHVLCLLCANALLTASNPAFAQATGWRPEKSIEIVAPATPGGLHDITARSLQQMFQTRKLVEVPVVVVNKGGGGGTVGWTYLNQQQADPHFVSLIAVNMLSNHVTATSSLHHGDFTPLAMLFHEYLGLAVKADSPVGSGKDMVTRLAKDPTALSVAVGTSLGNTGHLALSLAVKSAGGEPRKLKAVVFGSNGEAMTALLGGHVDAMMTSLSNLVRHVQGKTVRVIAVSAPQRAGGAFAHVPTWREQDVDVLMSGWRGVIAPRGLNQAHVVFWENVFARLNETDEWKQELDKRFWHAAHLSSRDTREFLDKEYQKFQQVLGDLGMAKRK